jgi:hypothetical protein
MWDPAEHMLAQAAKWVVLLLEPQREEQPGDTIVRWTMADSRAIFADLGHVGHRFGCTLPSPSPLQKL